MDSILQDSFAALHVVNKHAKQYNQRETTRGDLRASALYELKHHALDQWRAYVDYVERHYIKNTEYYCFYYDSWSFHIPEEDLRNPDIDVRDTRVLHDFDPSLHPHDADFTEKTALEFLHDEHQFNPNKYLPYDANPDAYWPYLDGMPSTPHY